jgi:iron complex transport system substrate-binding protein
VKRSLAALVAALGLLAACGDDGATDATASTTTLSEDAPAAADAPERIVSLSASSTETLFAIGAGDQVVAVDTYSNYPPEAPTSDLSAYEPSIEAITTYDPDLVVVDASDPELVAGLETVGIEVFDAPAPQTLDEAYAQIAELGAVTGHEDEAADLVESMQTDIDELVAGLPEREVPLTYFHELDNTLYSVTSSTFIGALYSLAGLESIADAADADGQSGGYPQLSAEFLVDADPDLIFLADTKCCAQTASTFAERPGFAGLQAVTGGQVIELDDDIASRWGPRVVDLLREIVEAVQAVPAA